MTISRTVLIAASTLLAASTAAAEKPRCVKDEVLTSFEIRMLQTELVVGALSCKLTPRYNEFVTEHRPELMKAHKVLLRYFGRESRLEDYKSRTANEASARSIADIAAYCVETAALYDKVLAPDHPKLASLVKSEPAASRHGQHACGAAIGDRAPLPRHAARATAWAFLSLVSTVSRNGVR